MTDQRQGGPHQLVLNPVSYMVSVMVIMIILMKQWDHALVS